MKKRKFNPKLLLGLVPLVAALLFAVAASAFAAPPAIPEGQTPPANHYGSNCAGCHTIITPTPTPTPAPNPGGGGTGGTVDQGGGTSGGTVDQGGGTVDQSDQNEDESGEAIENEADDAGETESGEAVENEADEAGESESQSGEAVENEPSDTHDSGEAVESQSDKPGHDRGESVESGSRDSHRRAGAKDNKSGEASGVRVRARD